MHIHKNPSHYIAITGTHSSGKTTLTKALLKELGISQARLDNVEAMDFGKKVSRLNEIPPHDFCALQEDLLARFSIVSGETTVMDGSPLSCKVYGQNIAGKEVFDIWSKNNDFDERAKSASREYDIHFYLPPEAKFEDDGFRPLDQGLRYKIDEELLSSIDVKMRVLTGNVADRKQLALNILGLGHEIPRKKHIAIEGLPRSGKSSVIKILKEKYGKNIVFPGRPVFRPDGVHHVQNELQKLYKDPMANNKELLDLFVQTFEYHMKETDYPSLLRNGAVVVSDRQKFSIIAMMRALGLSWGRLYEATRNLRTPGTVIYLDVKPEISVARAGKTCENHNLKNDIDFQRKVSANFKWLSDHHAEFTVVDANRSLEDVSADVCAIIDEVTNDKKEIHK